MENSQGGNSMESVDISSLTTTFQTAEGFVGVGSENCLGQAERCLEDSVSILTLLEPSG